MKTITVKELAGVWETARGLIGREHLKAVYFKTRWGVHTFFLNRPITVLILDNDSVLQSIKVLKPYQIFFWNPRFANVVEISGEVSKYRIGDKVRLINSRSS